MLNQQTLEKLHTLRLHGMAEAFRAQSEQTGITELSFEERFAAGRSAVDLATEPGPGAPADPGQAAASGLGGGHRLPLSPRLGPHAPALAHPELGLGA